MSMECSECERDLRGGHDQSCSRHLPSLLRGLNRIKEALDEDGDRDILDETIKALEAARPAVSECAGQCTDLHAACPKCKADFKQWLAASTKASVPDDAEVSRALDSWWESPPGSIKFGKCEIDHMRRALIAAKGPTP